MIEITAAEAEAALRGAAFTLPSDHDPEVLLAALELIAGAGLSGGLRLDPDHPAQSLQAIAKAALDTAPAPRVIVHCLAGTIGADWDLEGAVLEVHTADRVGWITHPLDHDLVAVTGGRIRAFAVRRPA